MKHTAESRQQADSEYAAYVREAYRALTLWCHGQHKIPSGFETFSTGVEAGIAWQCKQTPLQAAALDALVAWRKADFAWYGVLRWDPELAKNLNVTERNLRAMADRLIAEQSAPEVGR